MHNRLQGLGTLGGKLNFSTRMRALATDVVARTPEFGHVRLDSVVFSISHANVDALHGQFGKIIPMRFEGGSDVKVVKQRWYRMPKVLDGDREILYAIYFCMPKYMNLPFEDKLLTLFHEMYHISPAFNGDIRRFPGRNYAHGDSTEAFNATVRGLVNAWLASDPDIDSYAFLTPNADEFFAGYDEIVYQRVRMPKLIPEPVIPPGKGRG